MESSVIKSALLRKKRAIRVRSHLRGTSQKPRLCVVRSNAHIQAQLIDDEAGVTLGSISTFSKEFRQTPYCKKNKESAKQIGARIAAIAKEKSIEAVVFDRGPFKYHGVVAEVAEEARKHGLRF